tara:strand:- start:47 stop:238 length:192 start_codon:yes stop_codon:yes gene_type:complete
MKVYGRGDADLERRIEVLKERVKELEEINEKHKKLNGELRKELDDVRKASAGVPGPVHGRQEG